LSSTFSRTLPTAPNLTAPGVLEVRTGLVSVRPYPSRMITSNEAKNSATSEDSGAPPEIKNLIFPPSLALILL
jgi:hypothetical protein